MYAYCMEKDFDEWNIIKKKLDDREINFYFKEREIRWCNIGLNIGKEVNGKSSYFSRPVLIVKKLNKHTCFVIPLTNSVSDDKYFRYIVLNGEVKKINFGQIRVISSNRLGSYIGKVSPEVFKCIKIDLQKMFF